MKKAVSFLILFLEFWPAPYPSIQSRCSCGSDPRITVSYNSMRSHRSTPRPELLLISGEDMQVRVNAEGPEGDSLGKRLVTSDGGRTWKEVDTTLSSQTFGPPLATTYRYDRGTDLQRSRDGGKHWERPVMNINGMSGKRFSEMAGGSSETPMIRIAAMHPRNPDTVYGCILVTASTAPGTAVPKEVPGLFVSLDAGDNWKVFSLELRGFEPEGYCTLGISPENPAVMIGHGQSGVVVSGDGGKSWRPVNNQRELEKPAPLSGYSEARQALEKKGGRPIREWPFEWTYLTVIQYEFQPGRSDVIYMVTNKGLFKSGDGGLNWCLLETGPKRLFSLGKVHIDQENPRRLFLGTDTKILVSDDAGCHFRVFFDSELHTLAR